jgi:hypothetical protein
VARALLFWRLAMVRNGFFMFVFAMFLGGCVIVPTAQTHEVTVHVDRGAETTWGPIAWDIATAVHPETATVVVTAARRQACSRLQTEIYDAVTTKTTRVAWLLGDAPVQSLGDLLAIPLAVLLFTPVTAVSGIISGSIVAASHPKAKRLSRPTDAYEGTCRDAAANEPVALVLPSGTELAAVTGADGRATFAIPDGERYGGSATARIADQTRTLAFVGAAR